MVKQPIIVITGPTASGKTKLAVHLADQINAEIISADSRQIFKGMDIGTGKDLLEYNINNKRIISHLLDIKQVGDPFSVCEFQQLTSDILHNLNNNKRAIICGGTAFYIKSLIKNYEYTQIPPNEALRNKLQDKDLNDLLKIFKSTSSAYHNIADISTKRRLIRAIEIAQFLNYNNINNLKSESNKLTYKVFAIHINPETRRKLILDRLNHRLNNGLIQEVTTLLKTYPKETILNYGLEYKYIGLYVLNYMNYDDMQKQLFTQICRYAKRQMTFIRHLKKTGIDITWIPYEYSLNKKITLITSLL